MIDDEKIIELARRTGLPREEAMKFWRFVEGLRDIEREEHPIRYVDRNGPHPMDMIAQ